MAENSASDEAQAFLATVGDWLYLAIERSGCLKSLEPYKEPGQFLGYPAQYVYCTGRKKGRVDIYYSKSESDFLQRGRYMHGHVVIVNGVVTYIRRLADRSDAPLLDEKRGDSWNL